MIFVCELIIHDLIFRNRKINSFDMTFCKAFDSIPDFKNRGYQVEIVIY